MGDEWRRKTYYRPRVLIDTSRILDPQFPDSLLCITGAQIEMLRNLTQYLHRRSTFVSEQQGQYYLAPTNEEWDSLEAIVADLEDTLMGCTDITTALNNIAAQVACLCNVSRQARQYTPTTQDIVNYYVTEGDARYDDPYPQETVIDEKRCAVAQLVHRGAYEWLTEVIQPAQDMATDFLVPMVIAIIALWCGPAVFNIPTGTLLAAIWRSIEVWETGELENVVNTLMSIKEEVICAVYEGLLVDAQTAAANARDVIYEQDLAMGDKICLSLLCGSWMIAAAAAAWEEQTSWATTNVTPGYCEICAQVAWPYYRSYYWPPCPGVWTGGFPCSSRSLPGINQDEDGYSPEFELLSIVEDVIITIECDWYSSEAIAWTVGYITLQYWDTVGEDWLNIWSFAATNTAAAGVLNTDEQTSSPETIPYNLLRWKIGGQLGQGAIDPYPFEPEKILLTIVQDV